MKRVVLLITMILLMIANLSAADRQFYFIGKIEREGSISSLEKDKRAIYLRWDLIEGEMPSDIASIELIRVENDSNVTLLDVPADAIMSDENISTILQESSAQRRTFELIASLDKSDNPSCMGANLTNLPQTLHSCLEDNYWSFLASRVDFDVARIRYRAYIDREYDSSAQTVHYILLAKNSDATDSFILGQLDVDTTQEYLTLAVEDLKQIISSSCNDNRYALDDARIALFWRNGGKNRTESFANSLMVSGYDIYYSTVTSEEFDRNIDIESVDIAQLASELEHDANGNVDLSAYHLKKANETLVTVDKQDDTVLEPVYVETKETLEKRGFNPGEHRYYFVVPRDFTGNYGQTAFVKVVVPDLLPPVTPINPRVVESNGKAELIWDAVTFENYARHHQYDMKACTTKTVAPNSRVTFVAKDEVCDEKSGIELNFNVAKYYIYRFTNTREAAGFEDLDLDGYNDVEEDDSQKCNAEAFPTNAKNYLVSVLPATTQKVIHFKDPTLQTSKVYWYRIVSVTANGITSQPTAPIRAFIPKREVYKAPDINVTYDVLNITMPLKESADEIFLEDHIGLDGMYGITHVQLIIGGKSYDFPLDSSLLEINETIKAIPFLISQLSQTGTILFIKADNTIPFARNFALNTLFNFQSIKDDENGERFYIKDAKRYFLVEKESRLFHDGDVVEDGCVNVTFNEEFLEGLAGNGCIETSLAIGNRRYKRDKNCDISPTIRVCEDSLNGDLVSIGIRKVMYNGLYSLSTNINFVPAKHMAPHQPSLKNFSLVKDEKQAFVTIQPQIEKVTGTLLKLYNKKDKSRSFIKTVTHLGKNDVEETIDVTFDDLGEMEDGDIWCIKGKTIGLNGEMSIWSSLICKELISEEREFDILGWPQLHNVAKRETTLPVEFDEDRQTIRLLINQTLIQTRTVPKILSQDYTRRIAEDRDGRSAKLNIMFIKGEDILESVTVNKESDGNFYLPSKLSSINNNSEASRVTSVVLTFLTDEEKELFDEPLVLKAENILAYSSNSEVVINQYVEFVEVDVSSLKVLVDAINKLNQYYNYIVYRQSIDAHGNKSNFVQVTPLMEAALYDETTQTIEKSNNIIISDQGSIRSIYLVDRYPYIVGQTYKYVIVFFDKVSGEPVSYMLTSPQTIEIE